MKPAIDFGKDMVKLSATTFVQLIEIQLEDLATLVTHQSAIAEKAAAVHDMAGFVALQREYRDTFWKDRMNALAAAHKTIQVAMQRASHGMRELTNNEAPPIEAPPTVTPPEARRETPTETPQAATPTKAATPRKTLTPTKVTASTTATTATKKTRKRKRAPR